MTKSDEISGLEILDTYDLMVQPYLPTIATVGEVPLIYFNHSSGAQFSHGILKTPKAQDFRVQSEFGGRTVPLRLICQRRF